MGKKGKPAKAPVLNIDFTKGIEEIFTERMKSQLMGWDVRSVRMVESHVGIWDRFPMTCRGLECPFANRCPVSHRPEFLGTPCILEQIEAYRLFAAYVRELDIGPLDHVDLQMVSELVRLHLMQRRIELTLAGEGVTEEVSTVIGGKVVTNREINKLMGELRNIRKDMMMLYDKLLVSREARLKKQVAEERMKEDAASVFMRLRDRLLSAVPAEASVKDPPKMLYGKELSVSELEEGSDSSEQ
ncbi:MAG: hypothetical protein KatS3mg023_3873 [Armatimonadota bacterium]|nr:MAG: hypothetical protein KatS3mg023_3873 [Armatimonadota bacterium]